MRVALILALDTAGNARFAVTTANTDENVWILFMYHLARTLDAEEQGWRERTILSVDGASYHTL